MFTPTVLPTLSAAAEPYSIRQALTRALRTSGYEALPLKGALDAVIADVPVDVPLSVTMMTATKGLDATIDLAEALAKRGYQVTPHIAGRMVRDAAQLRDIVDRLADNGIDGIFTIAGDVPTQARPFGDSLQLLDALSSMGHHFTRLGIGGQMCFRSAATTAWARSLRDRGIALPIYARPVIC